MSTEMPQTARQTLRQAKKALYRESVLEAAEAAFAEAGYEATKVSTIARGAGVSLATLYGVFPKKWDIFRALQQDRLTELMLAVGSGPVRAVDPFERLRLGIEGYMLFHMEHPAFLKIQLREGVAWGTTDELRTPEQTRAWNAGLALMVQAFTDGITDGSLAADDPELGARTATAMSQVRLALWVRRGMREAPRGVVRATTEQLVRTFVVPGQVEARLRALAQ